MKFKKWMLTATELLSFSAIALFVGFFLEKRFSSLGGIGVLTCLFLAYLLWFLNFLRRNR